ncbi:MAG TPA: isoprenylcysteine carboxylmethyltransferase family protein [Propylenella sp.]
MAETPIDRNPQGMDLGKVQRRRRIILLSAAVLAAALLPFVRIRGDETLLQEVMETAGIGLIVLAILGRSWCTLYIGGRKAREIVAHGPYSISRNPLYVFSLIGIFGIGAQTGSLILGPLLGAIGFAVFLPVILMEERALARRFGEAYKDYRTRVPRFGPRPSAWRDRETVPAHPRRIIQTAAEAMLLLLAIPLFEGVEWLQETDRVAALVSIP